MERKWSVDQRHKLISQQEISMLNRLKQHIETAKLELNNDITKLAMRMTHQTGENSQQQQQTHLISAPENLSDSDCDSKQHQQPDVQTLEPLDLDI